MAEIAPHLAASAKHYWNLLQQPVTHSTGSHHLLRYMVARHGQRAVDAALSPYIAAEREQIKRQKWQCIVAFYAQFGLEPAADHPNRPQP